MKSFAAGKDVTLSVAFERNGQPAIPQGDPVTFSVYDPTGAEIHTGSIETGPTDFQVSVTVPAEKNEITTSFSKRIVVVRSDTMEVREVYRLTPFALYTIQPKDVRGYIGVNDDELPDDDIDIAKAFLELETQIGKAPLALALTSGENEELRANDAIKFKAALEVIPSLQNRVAQKTTDGPLSFQRNTRKDFENLRVLTEERLSGAIALISSTLEVPYSLLTTTNDADPITG